MDSVSSFLSSNASSAAYGVSLLIAILVAGYFYYDNQFKYFARLGLKNPKPLPVVGNFLSMFSQNRMADERMRLQECGKFYGIFQGTRPRFICADPEVLRQISIKDFDKFPNHEASSLLNDIQHRFIFFMQDDTWRQVRALQTPTFTSGKIKRMYKLLNLCADDLIDCFQEQLASMAMDKDAHNCETGAIVNLKDIYSLYTMDGIASCGYGLKLERKGSASIKSAASRNDFVVMAMKLFEFSLLRLLVSFTFNKKFLSMIGFKTVARAEIEPIANKVRHIIETRRKSNRKHDDYLQILLDANLDDQMELNEMDNKENHHAGLTHDSLLADQKRMIDELESKQGQRQVVSSKTLSDEDILASAVFLMVVGLETTSTLLTNCSYTLAFHQDIQEKLYEEVKKIAELNDDKTGYVFDYDKLTSCQYLDAVISESLRTLTPVLLLDRVAKEDYFIEKYNVTLPKGSKVLLAYHAIMNDPDSWPEPEKFDPERFMPGQREKIVPGSYCPFGLGPRHCLGMRFSLTEAKLGLAKVIMKYKFEPAPGTFYPPLSKRGVGLNSVNDPRVLLKLRQ